MMYANFKIDSITYIKKIMTIQYINNAFPPLYSKQKGEGGVHMGI